MINHECGEARTITIVYRSVDTYFHPSPTFRSLILALRTRTVLPCSRGVCMPESIALEITAFDSISSSAAELNLLSFRLTLGLFGRGLWRRL